MANKAKVKETANWCILCNRVVSGYPPAQLEQKARPEPVSLGLASLFQNEACYTPRIPHCQSQKQGCPITGAPPAKASRPPRSVCLVMDTFWVGQRGTAEGLAAKRDTCKQRAPSQCNDERSGLGKLIPIEIPFAHKQLLYTHRQIRKAKAPSP